MSLKLRFRISTPISLVIAAFAFCCCVSFKNYEIAEPSGNAADSVVMMALGSYIPAIESRELRIYYKSLFGVKNVNNYQVVVDGAIGTPYPRFWLFVPEESNTGNSYNVRFSLMKDDGSICAEKVTKIICLPKPSFRDKNILVVGASIYDSGAISQEMSRQLSGQGGIPDAYGLSDISFIGRKTGSQETGIHQEATIGWSWQNYASPSEENPFYNSSTHRIDFRHYSQKYCDNKPIDVLCIEFGWNSLTKNRSMIDSLIKPFLRRYHSDYPDGVVVFGGLQPPSPYGGLGVSYGSSSIWNWLTAFRYVLAYNQEIDKLCQEKEFKGFVKYWPACESFDCENAYAQGEVVSNIRTGEGETIEINGVHPTPEGAMQLADSAIPSICFALAGK